MDKRRLWGASALAILVAVGLAGCMKMDMQLDLQSDDTVDGTLIFAVASDVAGMLGESPESFAESLQADAIDLEGTESVSAEPYDDGEYVGTRTVFTGQTLDAFNNADDPDALNIVREGDEFVVTGAFDMTDESGDMGMFGGDFDIRIAVTFPGAVTSHDGELSGNTVTWRPSAGERMEMNARGGAVEGGAGGGLPIALLIGIGVLALVVIAVVVILVTRSGKKSAAPATAYPAPQAAPPAGYAPPPEPQATAPPSAPEAAAPPPPPAPEAAAPPPPPAPEADAPEGEK